ncbi:type II restriction endonuclease [Fonticella tunisiensis]|uniref:Type-2 restriction enzyme n=1 Tax=Fonticella tunisiensis TaxID=1096341 RepID=A0A4R7KAA6_9CLOT|nr:type II restriction endonuclease [Fonticella tunisiensis]TDT51286.1 type II restriction enzyme [Fonticella tunisiensis]
MGTKNDVFVYDKSSSTFEFLLDNLVDSIKGWNYFVNWSKVKENVKDIEIELNILNYLIGKENIREELKYLLRRNPEIIRAIPFLIASRDNKFEILNLGANNTFSLEIFDFNKKFLKESDIENIINFIEKTGLMELFKDKTIKNLVDYVFGVEVGLDSNGRKNRSGTAMEDLIETFLKNICSKYGYEYFTQATPTKIKSEWGYNVTVDKSERRFDFAVNTGKKLFLIETNYYGGGGSKLKATAGEYKTLFDVLNGDGHEFIWITDGKGWLTASRPLQETFNHNKYILNLKMIELGILEEILLGKLDIR